MAALRNAQLECEPIHCLPNCSVAAADSVQTGPCVVCPVVGVRTLCRARS